MSDTVPARNFALLLNQLEDGDLQHDLTQALTDLMVDLEEVRAEFRGKPEGSITITINFKDDEGVIYTKSGFKVSKPKRDRRKSIFWLTHDHHLSRQNPRQLDMKFQDVNRRDQAIDA